ncbi:MAG: Ig-like domain-containing protein [Oscillospiraceae bacterium]
MSVRKCPQCGEFYSDSYKSCPFCEEDAAEADGRPIRGRGGHHVAKKKKSGAISPILLLILLLLAALVVYVFFGDAIRETLVKHPDPTEQVTPAPAPNPLPEPENPDLDKPVIDNTTPSGEQTIPDTSALPETLHLSSNDFTAKAGETVVLKVSGGNGSYTWTSSDDGIATVTDGKVIAISGGMATVIVSDGSAKGTCIVRVRGVAAAPAAPVTPVTPTAPTVPTAPSGGTTAAAALSKTDVTAKAGESFSLLVTGGNGSVSWSTKDSAVATVTNGTVQAVSKGMTTITATVGGKKLDCIVRVR